MFRQELASSSPHLAFISRHLGKQSLGDLGPLHLLLNLLVDLGADAGQRAELQLQLRSRHAALDLHRTRTTVITAEELSRAERSSGGGSHARKTSSDLSSRTNERTLIFRRQKWQMMISAVVVWVSGAACRTCECLLELEMWGGQ